MELIPKEFDLVGITATDNSGGSPNIETYDMYKRMVDGDLLGHLDFVPHISCKDRNSDMIASTLAGYKAAGIEAMLVITGDKPLKGKSVFEHESVTFLQMIKEMNVDIFATNQLPKNYIKLGIDYHTLKALKPDIIWLGVTGFGPDSNEGAYDPILQARSGLMEMTGEGSGDPQVMGIPLPDMGTSEHAYGALMKALFYREKSGRGSCINLSMFESCVSWLTVPITMTASFQKTSSRRGNTHEYFCPVSVYQTQNGFIYLAVGNDRQWKAMVSQDLFRSLDIPAYEKNSGRIKDVVRLEAAINAITRKHPSEDLIAMFQKMTVPVSKIQTLPEVIQDPLVKKRLLSAQDPKTGTQITLAPAPRMTSFLKENNRQLEFPPRFGEDNFSIFSEELGYSKEVLSTFKEKGII